MHSSLSGDHGRLTVSKREERTRKFRAKNERRKAEQESVNNSLDKSNSARKLKELRKWRRSLLHGAFGRREHTPFD